MLMLLLKWRSAAHHDEGAQGEYRRRRRPWRRQQWTTLFIQIQSRNRIEGRDQREQLSKTRTTSEREKGKKWYIFTGTQSLNTGTHKEKRGSYCLLSYRTRLDTIHTPYPWQGTSYSSSTQERRGGCRGIIIIRMGPIGRHFIHRVRHTTYNTDSNIVMVVTLPSV